MELAGLETAGMHGGVQNPEASVSTLADIHARAHGTPTGHDPDGQMQRIGLLQTKSY